MAVRVRATDAPPPAVRERWTRYASAACAALGAKVYPDALTIGEGLSVTLVRQAGEKKLLVLAESGKAASGFSGVPFPMPVPGAPMRATVCPLTPENAARLRDHFSFLVPIVPDTALSIGLGDRLGLATPGHVRAVRGRDIDAVLAQQSIRELTRTQREPGDVIDSATWGVLQAGFREGYGADADHLTNLGDVDRTVAAGYTFFTVDPGAHVDASAAHVATADLPARVESIPWADLETTLDDCRRRYAQRSITVRGRQGTLKIELSTDDVLRTMLKYGRAIAHTTTLYRRLLARRPRDSFWFEVSVDETDSPTSAAEHLCWALELQRLGVQWDSLAPRLVGSFYKGVDYVGDLEEFREDFRKHVMIAEHFGTYKLSLHSGSDKFSIYPIIAELTGGRLHIKTSGTSYLEALRIVAQAAPDLFRELLGFAKRRYTEDRDDYHVGGDGHAVPDPATLRDAELAGVLDQPDVRQVCHVTYGSVLTARDADGQPLFRDRLLAVLEQNEEAYHRQLERHIGRHLQPFL